MIKKEVIPVQKELLDELVDKAEKFDQTKQRLVELQEKYDACQEARKLEAEFKNQEFMEHFQELVDIEKQLAEKDKEIEEYKQEQFEFASKVVTLVDNKIAETHHQVCDEIREKADKRNSLYKDNSLAYVINEIILDQIKKGGK